MALSFDADQTLWDFHAVQRKALDATVAAMIERGDVSAGQVTNELLRAARSEVLELCEGRPDSLEDVRERSFVLFLERCGHLEPKKAGAELVELYMAVRFDEIELYPEVRESHTRLKKKYKLGLLSNGNTYPGRCGLPNTFAAQILGPDHGFAKPDRRPFESIADALDVPLHRLMHIGDDWDDIEGANAVGAISVYMNRDGADPGFRVDADYEVRDLVELEALLS